MISWWALSRPKVHRRILPTRLIELPVFSSGRLSEIRIEGVIASITALFGSKLFFTVGYSPAEAQRLELLASTLHSSSDPDLPDGLLFQFIPLKPHRVRSESCDATLISSHGNLSSPRRWGINLYMWSIRLSTFWTGYGLNSVINFGNDSPLGSRNTVMCGLRIENGLVSKPCNKKKQGGRL